MHSGQGNRTFPQGSFHTSEVHSQLLVTSFQRSGSQLGGESHRTHNEEEAGAAWWASWTQGAPEAKVPRCEPQVFAVSPEAAVFPTPPRVSWDKLPCFLVTAHIFQNLQQLLKRGRI